MADDPPRGFEADDSADERRKGDKMEAGALDFLLGNVAPVEYDVPVHIDTPEGRKTLKFHIRQLDGDRILALEKEHRKGSGPFAELDDIRFNAALATAATVWLEDHTGKRIEVHSGDFAGDVRDPAIAMEKRFRFNPGILDGVCGQIRACSGYSQDRVESAERAVVTAAGN